MTREPSMDPVVTPSWVDLSEDPCVLIESVLHWCCRKCKSPLTTKRSRNNHESTCKSTEVRKPYHSEHLDAPYPCLFRLRVITFTYVLFHRSLGFHHQKIVVPCLTAHGPASIVRDLFLPRTIVIATKELASQPR